MAFLSLQQHSKNPEDTDFIRVLKERYKKESADKSSILTINGVSIHEVLVIEILSWLPVKTLLQFKSVSKSWYTIIASRGFISKHLENYYQNNQNFDCFLTLQRCCREQDGKASLSARLIDESLRVCASLQLKAPLPDFEISGPCNGIFYLSSPAFGNCLWNPTLNDLKVLPPLIMKPRLPQFLRYQHCETHGFGYDPLTEDYKVVVIKQYEWSYDCLPRNECCKYQYPASVLVYSLNTNSWKYWSDLPQFYDTLNNNKTHIFVNGCMYWVGTGRKDNFEAIISFNIVTNELQEIQIPNYKKDSKRRCYGRYETCLGLYKGSLAFYAIHIPYFDKACFNMWTFKEGCFTKIFSIGHIDPDIYLMGHFKNDMIILPTYDEIALFDPDTERRWNIAINDGSFGSTMVYQESLVPIISLCTNSNHTT